MAEPEIRQFISHLAIDAKISASTQTVALSALLFLYRDVLKHELPYVDHIELSNLGHRPRICRPFEELLIPRRCREYHRQGSMIRKLSCRSSGGGEPPFPT
jgi:integrase-like protein